ncbi:choice-of-anchor Q domain-containing protein [Haliscomenobacter sp.]|uniref:choice-of-anchor Q domain-containing protein n=1 Tax=Haliscomenobacter sp. TaxID=2717303 RepID=UPI0035932B2E
MNNKTFSLVFLFFVSSMTSSFTQDVKSKRIYVAATSSAGSEADGQSWKTAFLSLQEALKKTNFGDSVWIAQGIYTPTTSSDRTISFNIPAGIKLFGGFKGIEQNFNERDWPLFPTILSGKISGSENSQLNSFHVITLINTDSAIIDGIAIEGGRANVKSPNSAIPQSKGAGLLIINDRKQAAKIIIKNTIFRHNFAVNGGGIAILENALKISNYLQIENCSFEENAAESGGAIYSEIYNASSKVAVDKSRFAFNRAQFFAAVMHHTFSGGIELTQCISNQNESSGSSIIRIESTNNPITIKDCEFDSESLVGGGVIDIVALGDPAAGLMTPHNINIHKNKFSNILSPADGGAISLAVNGIDAYIKLNIEDCKIDAATSSLGANGIKIEKNTKLSKVDCNINRCVFNKNSISRKLFGIINFINYSGKGNSIKATINNSLFYKNTGPVIYASQYSDGKIELQILNSTFFGNKQGEIVRNAREAVSQISVYLQNTIFYNNQTSLSATLQNTTAANLEDFSFNHCLFSAPACTSTSDTTGCGIGNIFSQYPKFVDSSSVQGLKLAPGSVAINKGRWHPELTALDLLGQPRVQDCKVDLGAYESPSILSPDDTLRIKVQVRSTPINMSLGELDIQQIGGGFPPYRIRWENGDSVKVRSKLAAGQYTLTISDQMGCFKIYTYTVPFTTSINELAKVRERVYCVPNPQTKGQKISMHYEDLHPGQWDVQISDFSGKVLARQNHLLQAKGVLNFPQEFELPVGMYLITLRKDANVLNTKLMIAQ